MSQNGIVDFISRCLSRIEMFSVVKEQQLVAFEKVLKKVVMCGPLSDGRKSPWKLTAFARADTENNLTLWKRSAASNKRAK